MRADDLILFAHIIEAGSFTRAAEITGFPKATLSRRLSRLERDFGERLIQRSTRSLTITEFGERMLEHARRLSAESEEAAALALNRQIEPQGTLRVSLPPEFRQLFVADVITRFARNYPKVQLELDLSSRYVDLTSERFDVAVRAGPQLSDDGTLVARRISTQRSGLYAARSYLETHGNPDTPADLLTHTGLALMSGGRVQLWQLSHGNKHWEGLPKHRLVANSMGLQQELALRGLGIAGLPDHFSQALTGSKQLVRVLPDWQLPTTFVWCVTAGRRLLPKRTEAFIQTLRATLDSMKFDAT